MAVSAYSALLSILVSFYVAAEAGRHKESFDPAHGPPGNVQVVDMVTLQRNQGSWRCYPSPS
jgi:hypothetical protein